MNKVRPSLLNFPRRSFSSLSHIFHSSSGFPSFIKWFSTIYHFHRFISSILHNFSSKSFKFSSFACIFFFDELSKLFTSTDICVAFLLCIFFHHYIYVDQTPFCSTYFCSPKQNKAKSILTSLQSNRHMVIIFISSTIYRTTYISFVRSTKMSMSDVWIFQLLIQKYDTCVWTIMSISVEYGFMKYSLNYEEKSKWTKAMFRGIKQIRGTKDIANQVQ